MKREVFIIIILKILNRWEVQQTTATWLSMNCDTKQEKKEHKRRV